MAEYFVHKYEVSQQYGGPEEGGWWYDSGIPTGDRKGPYNNEDDAYAKARELNEREAENSDKQEYEYTSVLSYRSNHYAWLVSEEGWAQPYPENRPHYE